MNPLKEQIAAALAERYEIEREIGAGGMATVYLARDRRHSRRVAVKLLNPELGAVLGAERFLSEIRVTANLQHPNLLPLFDSGEADGLLFYVMPYVEGETLRARLEREKQLPVDEAVRIASAVAGALDYAHRHGVIHRDLKPENILLHDGQPLIADFGIALAVSNAGGARVTQTGLSLGTPQYMSPEQATGDRGIDGRTDIYSLGAVTYEMLTGEPPHSGTTAQAIIARLIAEEPRPISSQRRAVPEQVEDAVMVALQKLPADRFATAKDFADALNGRTTSGPTHTAYARRAAARRRTSPLVLAAMAIGGAAVGAMIAYALHPKPRERTVEFVISGTGRARYAPSGGQQLDVAPNGESIVYLAAAQGNGAVMLRRLDSEQGTFLPGTDRAVDVMYSPDSRRIAFQRDGKIFTMALDGTPPTELLTIGLWEGLTWADDHTIVYESIDTLWAVDATSAMKRVVTVGNREAGEMNLMTPIALPDGKTIAFFVFKGKLGALKTVLGFVSLDGSNRVVTDIPGRATIAYLDGWLMYEGPSSGGLMAVPFDVASRKAKGDPIRLADSSQVPSRYGTAMSRAGDLVHLRGTRERRMFVLGPGGEEISSTTDPARYQFPAWSPDGQRIVYQAAVPGTVPLSLWIYDVKNRTTARLETGGNSFNASWTSDGKRIVFIRGDTRLRQPYIVPADGSGPARLLSAADSMVREISLTPDGKTAVVTVHAPDTPTKQDIMVMPLDGSKLVPLVATAADEFQPVVSPDGKWVAYLSDASGRREVYARQLHGTGTVMLSRGGGMGPRWTRDGRIIYLDRAGTFRRVELTTLGGIPAAGRRDSLFTANAFPGEAHQSWDISADGRFAVVKLFSTSDDIVVSTNWWQRQLAKLKPR